MDRSKTGKLSHLKGQVAEDQIAAAYVRSGFDIVDRRFKTCDGEIDIVARHKDKFYFIEVKSSKTFDGAVAQITPKQQKRIQDCALAYLAQKAGHLDVDCRFDAALVDGSGRIKVMPGALLAA